MPDRTSADETLDASWPPPSTNEFTFLRELSRKVSDTALCQLERLASGPILTTLDRFGDEYRAHAERGVCLAGACRTDGVPPLLQPLPGVDPAAGAQPG